MWFNIILFTLGCEFLDACIPTQNVEGLADSKTTTTSTTSSTSTTTTTTTTTTTQTPLSSSPCTACPPIYISGCLTSGLTPDQCATAAAAGVTYSVGQIFPAVPFFTATDYCQLTFICPAFYAAKYKEIFTGSIFPVPGIIFAYCSQSGSGVGTWYWGVPPSTIEMGAVTCEPIFPG